MASVFVMATDNGTHPADKWADVVSQIVFPISQEMADTRRLAARSAQINIAMVLEPLIAYVLDHERQQLADVEDRASAAFDGHQFLDEAIAKVFSVTDATEWAQYMREHEDVIRAELNGQFNAMQDVERKHHVGVSSRDET